jgi:hypothetical protein
VLGTAAWPRRGRPFTPFVSLHARLTEPPALPPPRLPSTVHALLVSAVCLQQLLSGAFSAAAAAADGVPTVLRTTDLSWAAVAVSLGYFIADAFMVFSQVRAPGAGLGRREGGGLQSRGGGGGSQDPGLPGAAAAGPWGHQGPRSWQLASEARPAAVKRGQGRPHRTRKAAPAPTPPPAPQPPTNRRRCTAP